MDTKGRALFPLVQMRKSRTQFLGERNMSAFDARLGHGIIRQLTKKRQYRLLYYANELGEAKRTEFAAPSLVVALELAASDPFSRTVDIWEDGQFNCRLTRECAVRPADGPAAC